MSSLAWSAASCFILSCIALLAFSMAEESEAYALLNAVNLLSTSSFSVSVVLPSAMAVLMEDVRLATAESNERLAE